MDHMTKVPNTNKHKIIVLVQSLIMFTIWQWNCNGIKKQIPEITSYIQNSTCPPTIFCFQETHLKPNLKLENFDKLDYISIRKDRLNENKGGLLTLIHKSIPYEIIQLQSEIEHQVIKIHVNQNSYHIINIYDRTPNISVQEYIDLLEFPNQIVVGDFNAHNSIWGSKNTNKKGKNLFEVIENQDLTIHNDKSYTHIHPNGVSTLDLTLSSANISHQFTWSNSFKFMSSDHSILILSSYHRSDIDDDNTPNLTFNTKKANWTKYQAITDATINSEIIDDSDPIASYNKFETAVQQAAHIAIPTHTINNKRKVHPWWTDTCKEAIRNRNRARNKFYHHQTQSNFIEYKKQQALAKRTIKIAKTNHWKRYCNTLNTPNCQKMWKTIKSMKGETKSFNFPLKDPVSHEYITDNSKKANILAEHFSSISSNNNFNDTFINTKEKFEDENSNIINSNSQMDLPINQPFTFDELQSAIQHKREISPGPDNISYSFIKHLTTQSLLIMLSIFNLIWENGQIPPQWRHSIVIPIPKPNKSPYDTTSYRPISLTSCVCKIFETLVNNRLKWFLEYNKLLHVKQSGFRNYHSTTDHILSLSDSIKKALANRYTLISVFLDITKAYDLVWPKALLYKIYNIGIRGKMFHFIRNFILNRTFQTRVKNHLSSIKHLMNGVPQGSVVSPTLFSLFINDIPLPTKNSSLFADDVAIWSTGKSPNFIHRVLQTQLQTIAKWANKWGISFSPSKSSAIIFSNKTKVSLPHLKLNDSDIAYTKQTKFLGITFDNHLTLTDHINKIITKCNRITNIIRYISGTSWGVNQSILLKIFTSHIISYITYGAPAIITCSKTNIKRLEAVYNKALKTITKSCTNTAPAALQVLTGKPPVSILLLKYTLKYYVKAVTYRLPTTSHFLPSWHTAFKKCKTSLLQEHTGEYIDQQCLPISPYDIANAPPWNLKTPVVNTELTSMTSKESPSCSKSTSLNFLEQYSDYEKIYTDGSKIDSKTGYGIFIPKIGFTKSIRLPNYIDVFSAEAVAIINALKQVITNNFKKVLILTDSLSSLQAIKKLNKNPIIAEIVSLYNLALENGESIIFVWIPSHCGITGNEEADKLAKNATNLTEISEIPLCLNHHFSNINKYITNKWQNQWNTLIAHFYYSIQPCVKFKYTLYSQNKYINKIMTSLSLNNPPLNFYLSKRNCNISPKCQTCKVDETTRHYIFTCQKYLLQRNILQSHCRRLAIPFNIENLFNNSLITPYFIDFITRTQRFENPENQMNK